MTSEQQPDVSIRAWSEDDLPLLERLMGDPAMTVYVGGAETSDQLAERHERYCKLNDADKGRMFVIVVGDEKIPAGSVGYWEANSHGEPIWETGWSVLPEFQGQGIATKATLAVVEQARATGKHRFIHAFPSVENIASNAICRKAGFTLQGEIEFEYWRIAGKFMRCNDWRFGLFPETSEVTST